MNFFPPPPPPTGQILKPPLNLMNLPKYGGQVVKVFGYVPMYKCPRDLNPTRTNVI